MRSATRFVTTLAAPTMAAGLGLFWLVGGDRKFAVIALVAVLLIYAANTCQWFARDCLQVMVVVHLYLGMAADFYHTLFWFDELFHVLAMAWLTAIFVRRFEALGLVSTSVLAITLSLALGAGWEIFEFAIDSAFQLGAQQGLLDTNFDLIADGVGGLLAAVFLTVSPVTARSAH
ncbi:MAG: hypothetical protein AAF384_13200 [Pseudomonadota bacterium]